VAIRGISGSLCGRSFTLTEPKLVGRGSGCDIRIDDPALAERECQFELHGDRVVLRSLEPRRIHQRERRAGRRRRARARRPGGDRPAPLPGRGARPAGARPGPPARQAQQQHTQTMKAVRVPQSNHAARRSASRSTPPPQPVDPGALWWLIAAAAVLAAAMTALLVYSPHMGAA
jgi:hypothetical protein